MVYSYLLSVWYNGKTHQVDYCPYGREQQKCVKTFAQLRDELENEFGCEQIVMHAHNSSYELRPILLEPRQLPFIIELQPIRNELRPIRHDDDLLNLVLYLPNRGNLSITATGRKLSKQDLKLRKSNRFELVTNQKKSITRELGMDVLSTLQQPSSIVCSPLAAGMEYEPPLYLSPPRTSSVKIMDNISFEIRKSSKKLKRRISVNKRAAVEHYCAGSLEEVELLASEMANLRAEADALAMLATSLQTLGSVAKGVAVPHCSVGAAIQTIRHAAKYMNIVELTTIANDIASPWFTKKIRKVMPDWDMKPSSDSNQAFLEKLNVMESATPNAVNREMVLIAALGALKLWMKLKERQYVNSGYVSETSEIVLNPRSSSEASQSTRNFLEQLAHGLILDEPPITGVSLELNPGVWRQVRAC